MNGLSLSLLLGACVAVGSSATGGEVADEWAPLRSLKGGVEELLGSYRQQTRKSFHVQ